MRVSTAALLGFLIALCPAAAFSQMRQPAPGAIARGAADVVRGTSSQVKPDARTISVTGEGTAKTKPDLMIISFSIDGKAATSLQCSKLQADKTSKIVAALKAKLGDNGTVQTSDYSINPEMVPEPRSAESQSSQPSGPWSFSEDIKVNGDNVSQLTPLIGVAMAAAPGVRISGSGYQPPYPLAYARYSIHGPGAGNTRVAKAPKAKAYVFIIFTVDTSAETPEKAIALGSQRADKVEKALARRLAKDGSITVMPNGFWIHPVSQTYRPPPRPLEKRIYNGHTTLTVKTKRLDSLGALIQAGMANGANQVSSVTFTLSDASAARKEAIAAAAKDAQSKARTIAHSMGIKLGKILTISTNAQVRPAMLYRNSLEEAMGAASRGSAASIEQSLMPVLPRRVGVNAYLSVVYEID